MFAICLFLCRTNSHPGKRRNHGEDGSGIEALCELVDGKRSTRSTYSQRCTLSRSWFSSVGKPGATRIRSDGFCTIDAAYDSAGRSHASWDWAAFSFAVAALIVLLVVMEVMLSVLMVLSLPQLLPVNTSRLGLLDGMLPSMGAAWPNYYAWALSQPATFGMCGLTLVTSC